MKHDFCIGCHNTCKSRDGKEFKLYKYKICDKCTMLKYLKTQKKSDKF